MILYDVYFMKKKILIIEDEFELCMLLKLHLVEKNYEVEMAYNLKDGLDKLQTYNPDIIFLDNNLPDGLGWEKVPQIISTHPAIRINLITGDGDTFTSFMPHENVVVMGKPLSRAEIDKCLSL